MGALATVQTAVFDIAHQVRVTTREHLGHQAVVIRRLIPWMGVLKRLPMIGKDLLEDTPVPRGFGHHRVAPSEGDMIVTVKRLYHGLAASSTPHRAIHGHPHPARSSLLNGSFRDRKNEKSFYVAAVVKPPCVFFFPACSGRCVTSPRAGSRLPWMLAPRASNDLQLYTTTFLRRPAPGRWPP